MTLPSKPSAFQGFEPMHGKLNYLRCPNQFLETCVRHCKRGEIRLVGHFVYEAYRVVNEDGSPNLELESSSHASLRKQLGISNGAFDVTLDSCFQKQFINGVRGRGKGEYSIKCSSNPTIDPELFRGFYDGRGYWTPIPLDFFIHVIPNYTLAEIRVTACVLRHTLGYEEKLGHRRKKCALTVDFIQEYTGIADRKTVTNAIAKLEHDNVIECVERGVFHPNPRLRKPSVYGPKWNVSNGSKVEESCVLPESQPEIDFQKANQEELPKPQPEKPKTQPRKTSKKPTNRKNLPSRKTNNTQEKNAAAVSLDAYNALQKVGYNTNAAKRILGEQEPTVIIENIQLLPTFGWADNPLGTLRQAIREDWASQKSKQQDFARPASPPTNTSHLTSDTPGRIQRAKRRQELLAAWQLLSPAEQESLHKQAIEQATSATARLRLQRYTDQSNPLSETLAMIAQPSGTQPKGLA